MRRSRGGMRLGIVPLYSNIGASPVKLTFAKFEGFDRSLSFLCEELFEQRL